MLAAGLDTTPVDTILGGPVEATLAAFGPFDDDRIASAAEQGAYRWSLTLAGESVARDRADRIWEEVRNDPAPYDAYGERLNTWAMEERDRLLGLLKKLQEREIEGVDRSDLETLLFVAHFATQAESNLITTQSLVNTAAQDPGEYYDSSMGRRTTVKPLAHASVFLYAAERVLDQTPQTGSGTGVDLGALQAFLDEQDMGQGGWLTESHGTTHLITRHLAYFERAASGQEMVKDNLTTSLAALTGYHIPALQEQGFPGARAKSTALDASWWLERRTEGDEGPLHADMEFRIAAAVEAARYESELLLAAIGPGGQGTVERSPALPLAPIALLLVGGLLAASRSRPGAPGPTRMNEDRHTRRPGKAALALLIVGALVTSGFVLTGGVDGRPLPDDPVPSPVPVTTSERFGADVTVLSASDDTIHFAWGECLDPPNGGCDDGRMALKYRTYDPKEKEWSDTIRVRDPEGKDAYLPLLRETNQGITLVWLEGIAVDNRNQPPTQHPAEVWFCILDGTGCTGGQRISGPEAGVESAAAAVGPDGRLRVAWSEARDNQGHIVFRQQTSQGWGGFVEFSQGVNQWMPDVTVGPDGTAHVIWVASDYELVGPGPYRLVFHAEVKDGANAPSNTGPASQHIVLNQGAAVAMHKSDLHLVYGTEWGLFHRTQVNGEWTQAYNVSQTQRMTQRPDLVATENGVAAVWLESVHPHPPWRIRMAELVDDMWLRPLMVLEPPHRALSMPRLDHGAMDLFHLAWPGRASDEDPMQPHYLTLASHEWMDVDPPRITSVHPHEGSWNRHDPIEMEADLSLAAPLNREETEWRVNGAPVDLQIASGGLFTTVAGLAEGTHQVQLVVTDRGGNRAYENWTFQIDRTQPEFTSRIVDDDGNDVDGWTSRPVRVTGEIIPDDGAPAWVEVQAVDPQTENAVRLGQGSQRWTPIGEDGVEIPEGFLLEVTVRARDEAGNIRFGDPVQVGWDTTPPALKFDVPEWTNTPNLEIQVETDNQTRGSPIHFEVELTPEGRPGESESQSIRVIPNTPERIAFEELSDGRYTLNMVSIRDEAGNEPDEQPGPWGVGVDTKPPQIIVEQEGDAYHVEARDEGSGIAFLQATQQGNMIQEAQEEPGQNTASLRIAASALTEPIRLRAEDIAGNENRKILHPDGSLEEDPEATTNETPDSERTPRDDDLNQTEESDPETLTQTELPGPSIAVVALIVALFIWIRRWNTTL